MIININLQLIHIRLENVHLSGFIQWQKPHSLALYKRKGHSKVHLRNRKVATVWFINRVTCILNKRAMMALELSCDLHSDKNVGKQFIFVGIKFRGF